MTENMKNWLEVVSKDKALQEKLMKLKDEAPEHQKATVTRMAKEKGIVLTTEDFASAESEELSDDELDAVAGGGGCGCPVVGGGAGADPKTGEKFSCGCFSCGCGEENGKDHCFCPIIGGGTDEANLDTKI